MHNVNKYKNMKKEFQETEKKIKNDDLECRSD